MFPENMTVLKLNSVAHGFSRGSAGTGYNYSTRIRACEMIFKVRGVSMIAWGNERFREEGPAVRFLPNTGTYTNYRTETLEEGEWYLFSFLAQDAPEHVIHMPLQKGNVMEELYASLWRTWTGRQEGYYARSMALAYRILDEANHPGYLPREKADLLRPAVEEIERNLFGEIDCTSLHLMCGVSYTHFKNLFIRRYGMPPKEYISALRMRSAREMLENGQMSIRQISETLGYASPDYFSRLFRQKNGCSAEAYRKSVQGAKKTEKGEEGIGNRQ